MCRLIDGPAKGKWLRIKRFPLFLRVVIAADGTVDALDQLEDQPREGEKIHVYIRVSSPSMVHVDGTRWDKVKKRNVRFGEWFETADYKHHKDAPADAVMRSPKDWPDWCQKTYAAMKPVDFAKGK